MAQNWPKIGPNSLPACLYLPDFLVADPGDQFEARPELHHLLQSVGAPLRHGLHTGGDANLLQLQGEHLDRVP